MAKSLPGDTLYLEDVSKSMYGDDWLRDFEGSPLFPEAVALCERELDLKIKQTERRAEPQKVVVREESHYDKMERIRLSKKKLALQLSKERHQRQKKMTAAMSKGTILDSLRMLPGEELNKDE